MNPENSKTFDQYRLILILSQKINLKGVRNILHYKISISIRHRKNHIKAIQLKI